MIIKLTKIKDKERIIKAARKKKLVTYKGNSRRLLAYFSTETFIGQRKWDDIFKILKGKNCQPSILFPAKLFFRNEEKMKTFLDT